MTIKWHQDTIKDQITKRLLILLPSELMQLHQRRKWLELTAKMNSMREERFRNRKIKKLPQEGATHRGVYIVRGKHKRKGKGKQLHVPGTFPSLSGEDIRRFWCTVHRHCLTKGLP